MVTLSKDPCAELALVEAEVEVVTATLSNLIHQVHVLKERINDLYSPIIRMIPPEIFSEIFNFCLYTYATQDDIDTPTAEETSVPLKFGAVCSSWRRTAWSTPELWSSVTFHFSSAMKLPTSVLLLEQWLARSGALPLSVRLYASEDVSWMGSTSEGIMNVISKFKPRWKYLDIRLPSLCYNYLPTCIDGTSFPLLHTVILRPPGGQSDRVHKVNIRNAPQLRHVVLSCLYLRSLSFQWDALTSFDLESFYIDETLEMLRMTVSLVDLTMRRILGGDDRHQIPDAPIVLLALETINIINDKGTDLQLMFKKITAPKLREFRFSGDRRTAVPATEVISFFLRSECKLEVFDISKAVIREEPLINVLSTVPTLTTLSLTMPILGTTNIHSPLTDRLIQLCHPNHTRANQLVCYLPELKSLSYYGAQGFSWPVMLNMLESRCPTPEFDILNCSISQISDVRLSLVHNTREISGYGRPPLKTISSLESMGVKTLIDIEVYPDPEIIVEASQY